jgi:hypothetical protein
MTADGRDEDDADLLRDARAKAERLVAGLLAQSRDMDRFADRLAPEKLAEGRAAFARAIESARRTVEQIDLALRVAPPAGPPNSTQEG